MVVKELCWVYTVTKTTPVIIQIHHFLWEDIEYNPKKATVKKPKGKKYRILKKTEKSQVFDFLLSMPLAELKNVV